MNSEKVRIRITKWVVIAIWTMAVRSEVQATSVTITNASFEIPVLTPTGGVAPNSPNDSNQSFYNQTGWRAAVSNPNYDWVGEYYAAGWPFYTDPIPNGNQVGYIYGFPGTLWQTTSKAFLADETYSLTASLGQRTDSPFAASFLRLYVGTDTNLVSNNTLLKQFSVSVGPGSGKWFTQSMTFGPTDAGYAGFLAAHQGEPLIVALFSQGAILGSVDSETDWDSVQFAFIPEPTSLIWLTTWGLLVRGWRRREAP